ncbi:hypothetical protein NMY22_g19761 [Coprinellus aureogranulatus]|nr:hypothetical protein NMY22_g19761 [Coprinellus aureogranulatus]
MLTPSPSSQYGAYALPPAELYRSSYGPDGAITPNTWRRRVAGWAGVGTECRRRWEKLLPFDPCPNDPDLALPRLYLAPRPRYRALEPRRSAHARGRRAHRLERTYRVAATP